MGCFRSKLRQRVIPLNRTDIPANNSLSNGNLSTKQKPLHSNRFTILWLDAHVEDHQKSLSRLQDIFTSFHTFTNSKDCLKYLSTIKNEMIIMIVSDNFFPQLLSRIKSMSEIDSIYILSSDEEKQSFTNYECEKIKGIFTQVEMISNALKRHTNHYNRDSLIMSIIPSMKYAKKDLQQVNQLFIYWMLVKQIILETNYEGDVMKDLTNFCRSQYFGNTVELKNIDEFERNYHRYSPIWWYTQENFIFDLLSRALQTQDIEIIIRMGFFIKDLHQQIEKLQVDALKIAQLPIVVYRSQNVSNEDFEKMKSINGSLLAFNNFIMADPNYETSLNLARRARNYESGIGILFRIKIQSKRSFSPFGFLQNISYSPNKGEYILFSMHSIFHIIGMKQIEDRLWKVDLTLAEFNDEHILSLTELLRHETQESTGWFKLAQLMTIVRDYDHARDIYFALLDLVTDRDILKMADIYNELGILEDELGDYMSALLFYQNAIKIREKHLPPNHRSLSVSLNNLGEVQRHLGDYFNALSTHKKTLHIKQKSLPRNHLSLSTSYNNLGLTSEVLGEFPAALEFYQKALEIKRKALPPDHQELARTYNNIGELYRAMGNFPAALTNLETALSIRLKKVTATDPSLVILYNNLGLVHDELGNFPKAISYLEKSRDVKVKHFSEDHPSLAFSYNNLGSVHQRLGQFSKALSFYEKALDIQQKNLVSNHPEVAVTFTNMGVAQQALGNYDTAKSFYQKALAIREKSFPSNHPLLGLSYNNLGHLAEYFGQYNTALEYYQKTLKLQKKSLSSSHPALASTYNNLADVRRKLKDYKDALRLYKKSLDIKKQSLSANHPAFIITYNNLGTVQYHLKNYTAALEYYKQTLEISQKTLPPNHPDSAAVHNNMGVVHQSKKEYSTALDCYKKALEIQKQSLPEYHSDIATTYNSIATVLVDLGDFEGALEHEQRAIDIASQTLPPDHIHLMTFRDYYQRIKIKVASMKNK